MSYTAIDLSDNDRTVGTVVVTYVPIPDEAHESTVQASPVATYTFVAGQPASSQSSTVTVTLKDSTGSPIAGDAVTLAPSTPNAVVTPVAGGVSDSSGVATFTVTDPDPEHVTFTATDATTSTQLVETAAVSFVLRPDEDTTSTITAAPTPVEADGTSSSVITVTLHNNGVLLTGDTVSLSQGSGSSVITTNDPVSNASGQVQFTVTDLTAQSVAYQATDLTTATELTHDAVVTFTAPPGGSLQPSVTAIDPTSGPGSGGTQVTVTGSNFANATAVDFGTEPAPTFTISPNGTEIVATSPIPVAAGSVNITVSGPGGTSPATAADVFTYGSAPPLRVTTISPSSGPVAGGTKVTLTGTGLAGTSSVRFGTQAAASFTVNPGGRTVTAVAPLVSGSGRVDIVVTAGSGTSPANAMDVFAFVGRTPSHPAAPALRSLAPSSGPLSGGTVVTVHGTGLAHATKVTFGGVPGTELKVDKAGTALTVKAPRAARAGTVRVVVTTSVGSTASVAGDRYRYVAPSVVFHRLAKAVQVLDAGGIAAGQSRTLRLAGSHGVPAGATAVEVRVAVTAGAVATTVRAAPAGRTSGSATLQARARRTTTRVLTVGLGAAGAITLTNGAGTAKVVVTLIGYDEPVLAATARRASGRAA